MTSENAMITPITTMYPNMASAVSHQVRVLETLRSSVRRDAIIGPPPVSCPRVPSGNPAAQRPGRWDRR